MGDILSGFMKSQRGEVIAADATNWFGGPQGTPRWAADLPDKQIGSWWAKRYDAVRSMLTTPEKTLGDPIRNQLEMYLDDWSSRSDHTQADWQQMDSVHRGFSSLLDAIQLSGLATRPNYDAQGINDFRSAGFTTLLVLGAAYERQAPGEFPEKLAAARLAAECDRIHDRVGDPPIEHQIRKQEQASAYWLVKSFSSPLYKTALKVKASLEALESDPKNPVDPSDPQQRALRIQALGDLVEQIDELQGEASKLSADVRDATDMLIVEAVREPLGAPRANQPDDKLPLRGVSDKDLARMAEAARQYRTERRLKEGV